MDMFTDALMFTNSSLVFVVSDLYTKKQKLHISDFCSSHSSHHMSKSDFLIHLTKKALKDDYVLIIKSYLNQEQTKVKNV